MWGWCSQCASSLSDAPHCLPQTLKEKLQGLGKDIQAVDTSDLDYEVIKKQLA